MTHSDHDDLPVNPLKPVSIGRAEQILTAIARDVRSGDDQLTIWAAGVLVVRQPSQLVSFLLGYKESSICDPSLADWEFGDGLLLSQSRGISLKLRSTLCAPLVIIEFNEYRIEALLSRLINTTDPLADQARQLTEEGRALRPSPVSHPVDQPHRADLAQRAAGLLDRVWLRALTAPIAWD